MTIADFPPSFLRLLALAFGLVWGSFLNVVIHRLPRGMSLSRPGSHCPACKTPIRWYRNVPLISWLWMRGRAPCCGAKIAARYPLVELAGGVLSLAVMEALVLLMPLQTELLHAAVVYLAHFGLVLALVAAAFIDLEYMIVPDSISIGGTVLGLATFSLRSMTLLDAVIGAAVGFLVVWLPFDVIYARLRGAPGMGLGDAKLLMLAGAWFGWGGALFVLAAGAIQGSLVTLLLVATGQGLEEPEAVKQEREELRKELEALPPEEREELEGELGRDPLAEEPEEGLGKARIAFGPFLILATLECLLIGRETIFSWILPP
jgi:leader peptidase (prepilin peptidase)/N-methyltransferase